MNNTLIRRPPLQVITALLALLVPPLLSAEDASARSAEAPFFGCDGCHGGTQPPAEVELLIEGSLSPGIPNEMTLVVRGPNIARAGFFATSYGIGTFEPGPGAKLSVTELTHDGPAVASSGQATFQFTWTPPAEPGGADIAIFAVAANGDNRSRGDSHTDAIFSFAWGCDDPVTIYVDRDRDGFGSSSVPTSVTCAARDGWSQAGGDCWDSNAEIYPGAPELCNGRDDDCDGAVDEEVALAEYYVDADGDGFGDPAAETVLDCAQRDGYADNSGDCDDRDPARYTGAEEVCDLIDNDCDSRVDEGARARCGVGWCERLANTCDPDDCTPGKPVPETCNALDDDCDGIVDNGVVCPDGEVCFEYRCIPAEDAAVLAAQVVTADPRANGVAVQQPRAPGASASGSARMSAPTNDAGAGSVIAGEGRPADPDPDFAGGDSAANAGGTERSGCSLTTAPPAGPSPMWWLLALGCSAALARRTAARAVTSL